MEDRDEGGDGEGEEDDAMAPTEFQLSELQLAEMREAFELVAATRLIEAADDEEGEGEEEEGKDGGSAAVIERGQVGEVLRMLGVELGDDEVLVLVSEEAGAVAELDFGEFHRVALRYFATYDAHDQITEAFVCLRSDDGDYENQKITAASMLEAFRGVPGGEDLSLADCQHMVDQVTGQSDGTAITWHQFQSVLFDHAASASA